MALFEPWPGTIALKFISNADQPLVSECECNTVTVYVYVCLWPNLVQFRPRFPLGVPLALSNLDSAMPILTLGGAPKCP